MLPTKSCKNWEWILLHVREHGHSEEDKDDIMPLRCWVCVLCLFTLIVVEILFVLYISFRVRKLKINLKHSSDANITFHLDLKKYCNFNSMMYPLLFSHIPYFCKYKHHYIYEGIYTCQLWLVNILIYKIINIACSILTSKLAKGVKAKANTGTLEHSTFK